MQKPVKLKFNFDRLRFRQAVGGICSGLTADSLLDGFQTDKNMVLYNIVTPI